MRMSLVALSVDEHIAINLAVHDMLRDIKVLADFARKEGGESEYMVAFRWCKDDEGVYQLSSETTSYFQVVNDSEIPLALKAAIWSGCWTLPEGCKLRDCVSLLYTEIAILAFAMTNGAVTPWSGEIAEEHPNIVISDDKKEFILKFNCIA